MFQLSTLPGRSVVTRVLSCVLLIRTWMMWHFVISIYNLCLSHKMQIHHTQPLTSAGSWGACSHSPRSFWLPAHQDINTEAILRHIWMCVCRVCVCVCVWVTPEEWHQTRRLFHGSFTEAPCLSARQDGLFERTPVLFDFQLRVVFGSPGPTLHHFPSTADSDKKCHSVVVPPLTKASSQVVWKLSTSNGDAIKGFTLRDLAGGTAALTIKKCGYVTSRGGESIHVLQSNGRADTSGTAKVEALIQLVHSNNINTVQALCLSRDVADQLRK